MSINQSNLIYLASPYSKFPGGRERAFHLVCKKAAELMLEGYNVFCPIAHSHPIEVHGNIHPDDANHSFWLKQEFAVLEKCSEVFVYMMPSWKESYGVNEEIKLADKLGIPIRYLTYDETGIDRAAA